MIKIFQFLWHGCWHKWEYQTIRKSEITGMTSWPEAVYQCSKCNHIEARRF